MAASRGLAGSLSTLLLLGRRWHAGSKSGQKFKQGGVDLARAFLLDPMAGAIDQLEKPQIPRAIAHQFDQVDARHKTQHGIKTACNEGGRLLDALVSYPRLLRKIERCCAVAVEWAAEATLPKLCDVVVEVGRRKPSREGVGIDQAVEQPRVGRLVEL